MTRLNEELVDRFEFLEDCRVGLEMIPEECGRQEYLDIHDHLVKNDIEAGDFRSHMEQIEPAGLTVEAFTIPIYLDTVYDKSREYQEHYEVGTPEAWEAHLGVRWKEHWENAVERGTAAAERYAVIADSAQRRGISATAMFTNSYQLAAPRVEQEMFDRAYEVLSESDAEVVRALMQKESGDPVAVHRGIEQVLAGTDVSEANRAYLLSVVSEYDVPGSALTREQANASYPAPQAPVWPQTHTSHLDVARQAPSMSM